MAVPSLFRLRCGTNVWGIFVPSPQMSGKATVLS
jgi:hypothetical protein